MTLRVPLLLNQSESSDKLQLKRCNANHVNNNIKIRNRLNRNKLTKESYVPHPLVIRQFASYPYLNYSNILVHGYIDKIGEHSVPPQITKLCQQYYFIKEDGLFQSIYKISRILKKLKRRCITIQLLTVIIMKYLHVNSDKATLYCNDLIQSEYIVPVQPIKSSLNMMKYIELLNPSNQSNQKLYQISITTSILFNRLINK